MENARPGFLEVKFVSAPKCISASGMKKCPATVALFGHDISIRSGRFGGRGDVSGVDIVRSTRLENLFPERIFADKSRAKKWKRRPRFGQINQNIVRSAASALRLAADVA